MLRSARMKDHARRVDHHFFISCFFGIAAATKDSQARPFVIVRFDPLLGRVLDAKHTDAGSCAKRRFGTVKGRCWNTAGHA